MPYLNHAIPSLVKNQRPNIIRGEVITLSKIFLTYSAWTLLNLCFSYGLLMFFSNSLSKSDYGVYGVVSTIAGLFLILLNYGHKEAIFKAASQDDRCALETLLGSLRPWLLRALLGILLLLLLRPYWGVPALAFFFVYLIILLAAFSRGYGNYHADAAAWPVYRFIWLIIGLLFFWFFERLTVTLVFAFSIIAAILTLAMLGGFRAFRDFSTVPSKNQWPFANHTLNKFFALEIATVAYLKMDIIVLSSFGYETATIAEYFFAIQLFEAAILVITPLTFLFFNRLNKESIESTFLETLSPYVMALFGIITLILIGWLWCGAFLLEHLFPRYVNSFILVAWLLTVLVPMGLNMLFAHALIAWHKERILIVVWVSGLLVSIAANIVFIGHWGVLGATWARLATESIIMVMLFFWLGFRRYRVST